MSTSSNHLTIMPYSYNRPYKDGLLAILAWQRGSFFRIADEGHPNFGQKINIFQLDKNLQGHDGENAKILAVTILWDFHKQILWVNPHHVPEPPKLWWLNPEEPKEKSLGDILKEFTDRPTPSSVELKMKRRIEARQRRQALAL